MPALVAHAHEHLVGVVSVFFVYLTPLKLRNSNINNPQRLFASDDAGARILVAGSAIFNTPDPERATRELKAAANGALASSSR